ncbi:hypothetical protein [Tenacibaculum halocynthiae]|uniref:hypothetical protein n=1 Tax=Tenacibaculum halocynthiae TaxID=1254437 RepID=UPI003D65936B
MKNQLNLADVEPVELTCSYNYTMRLYQFNGVCYIHYTTDSPLLCSGTINLCTIDGHKVLRFENANPSGGIFNTGEPWGSGYYAQWNVGDSEGVARIIGWTPTT